MPGQRAPETGALVKNFATIDYVIVIIYLLAIAALGSSFYRRKSTAKDYFLGGRRMSWIPVGISIIAADLSAISVMGQPAWFYKHNLELLWVSVGVPLAAPIIILVFVPFYARLNLYTAYEYLEKRFNLQVRLVTSILFQFLRSVHVALVIYAPSLVINLVTGLPVWQCIVFTGAFTTIYTTLGGIKAVIWTDVIQFCTVISGLLLISFRVLSSIKVDIATAAATARQAGRLGLVNFSTNPAELTSFWACIFGGLILGMAPLATDQAILQRLFTTKGTQDARRSVILQAILVIPINLLLALVGLALFVFYNSNPSHLVGLNSEDAILPFFAIRELPQGISGLIIACIFAATMAVMSAGINSLTTATTVDFYQRIFRPRETPQHYATVGRIGTLCWGIIVTLFAFYAKRLGALALAYSHAASIIAGPMLGIFLLGMLNRRATAKGSLLGALAAMLIVGTASFSTNWSFFWLGPVGVLSTIVLGAGFSLVTAPNPAEKVGGLVLGHGEITSEAERVNDNETPLTRI
jgi:solute:Na+ symporter, SSS family